MFFFLLFSKDLANFKVFILYQEIIVQEFKKVF